MLMDTSRTIGSSSLVKQRFLARTVFASTSELYLEHPPMKFDMPQIIAFIVLWMVVAFMIFTFF